MAKTRAYLPLILAAALLIAAASYGIATSQPANGVYDADGDGLIEVANLEQLNAIRYDLDSDGMPNGGADAYAAAFPVSDGAAVCVRACDGYELARALDFDAPDSYASGVVNDRWTSGAGWLPIGVSEEAGFAAIFDGNGHTIANLYINRTIQVDDPGYVGLFGYIREGSVIRNMGMVEVDVAGGGSAGGLAGMNGGSISSSYAIGNVAGGGYGGYIGGLAAYNGGTISASYATGNVSADDTYGGEGAGGLAGGNGGTISTSYATSDVLGGTYAGGLVARNEGTISGSHAVGSVSSKELAGGLAGRNVGAISVSYATGNVSTTESYGLVGAGGLVGRNDGSISASYATGEVMGGMRAGWQGLTSVQSVPATLPAR